MALISCASLRPDNIVTGKTNKISFSEVWGYLMIGEEKQINGHEPFTHIFYFSLSPDTRGRIQASIERPDIRLSNGYRPSVHLVIADLNNYSLMHFCLTKSYQVRDLLIDDIIRVSEKFDGVQIDFEAVSPGDAGEFYDFLKTLRERLDQDKMLSIAVPARKRFVADAYQYQMIVPCVDRMVIMAYDEHWSTSNPGPVASLSWCMDVASYVKSAIPKEKIIMGLPLYGRAWQDKKLHRAVRHNQVEELLMTRRKKADRTIDGGPRFEYSERVNITVYYDDELSLMKKLLAYKDKDIDAVSFWRIGQGPSGLWNNLIINGK
jgi:spore germination protein YaaH